MIKLMLSTFNNLYVLYINMHCAWLLCLLLTNSEIEVCPDLRSVSTLSVVSVCDLYYRSTHRRCIIRGAMWTAKAIFLNDTYVCVYEIMELTHWHRKQVRMLLSGVNNSI